MQISRQGLLKRCKFLLTSNCEECKKFRTCLICLLEKEEYDYVYKNLKVLNRQEILKSTYPIRVLFSLKDKLIEIELNS